MHRYRVIFWLGIGCLLVTGLFPATVAAKKQQRVTEKVQAKINSSSTNTWNREWGVGLILGDPTGVTVKYWLDYTRAVDFALGSMIGSGVGFHSDYLLHIRPFNETPEVPIYMGGGLFLGATTDTTHFGVRGVFGIAYMFTEPFDVFFELAPKLYLLQKIDFGITLALGGRIYF